VNEYKKPVSVSGTDGVGSKLKLAQQLDQHQTIGIDLVAMCVNDIIVCGAKPLYFLDYYATGKLSPALAQDVIHGIGEGCLQAQCALVGGETAEMPGMYQGEDYDLAGFVVGIVEKDQIIDGNDVSEGDTLIALGSSGPHSNGYSLIRKVIAHTQADLNMDFEGKTLGEALLAPTHIYVQSINALLAKHKVHAMAHITGGGLIGNLPRVLPDNCAAVINNFELPAIFNWIQTGADISQQEMLTTFNCGVGMVLCVAKEIANDAIALLTELGENAWELGHIKSRESHEPAVII